MDNKNNNFFSEAFKDFERKPSDKVWTNIENNIKIAPVNKSNFIKSSRFFVGSVSVITLLVLVYFIFTTTKDNSLNNNDSSSEKVAQKIVDQSSGDEKTIQNELKQDESPVNNPLTNIENNKPQESPNSGNNQVDKSQLVDNNQLTDNKIVNTSEVKGTAVKPILPISVSPTTENKLLLSKNSDNNVNHTAIIKEKKIEEMSFSPDQSICKGENLKISVTGGIEFLWSTGERSRSIIVNPFSSTDYSVIATDEIGNRKTGLISVTVINCESMFIPNAFTPNGDGQHDVFKPVVNNGQIRNYEIIIVSRLGQVVFTSRNIDNGWDGNINGNPAPLGTYVYNVKYIDELNKAHSINGHVNVIR